MSTPGTGNTDGNRDDGGYVPGAYSADDDTSGDYVPGMYSGSGSTADTTPTREQDRTPVSATREQEPRTQAHTQAVPVSATRHADDVEPGTREHRLPRGAAAGVTDHETGSRSGLPTPGDRKLLHQREKEHFSGMRFGAGFFGWLEGNAPALRRGDPAARIHAVQRSCAMKAGTSSTGGSLST